MIGKAEKRHAFMVQEAIGEAIREALEAGLLTEMPQIDVKKLAAKIDWKEHQELAEFLGFVKR